MAAEPSDLERFILRVRRSEDHEQTASSDPVDPVGRPDTDGRSINFIDGSVVESARHGVFMTVANCCSSTSARVDHTRTRTRTDAATGGNVAAGWHR